MDADLSRFLADFSRLAEAASRSVADVGGERLQDALQAHLGADPARLPVVAETVPAHRITDAALLVEEAAAADPAARLAGIGGQERHHAALADMVQAGNVYGTPLAEPEYATVATGPDTQRRIAVSALHLFRRDGAALAVLFRGPDPQYGRTATSVEVLGADPEAVDAFLGWFRAELRVRSIFKGHVVSFTANEFEATAAGVTFHRRPRVAASEVVLPVGALERIERHVVGLGEHREHLRSRGQHLKRGVLLYGPPGTGKTHTVRYLLGRAEGTTAVLLAGGTLALVSEAARLARALQPAVVVLEDCDLVAEDRGFGHGPQPLLFEVLDAMDGLDADADVAFVLTTNRVDMLERALAQRPGRVDLAVEIPRPDRAQRRALLDLYACGLGFGAAALDDAAERTEGTTASFTKELVRRAVLAAAVAGTALSDAHLAGAVGELMADGAELTRSLLGAEGAPRSEAAPEAEGTVRDGDEGDFGSVAGSYDAPPSFGYFAYAPRPGQVPGAPSAYTSWIGVDPDRPGGPGSAGSAGEGDGD